MTVSGAAFPDEEDSRRRSLRYFNLYRVLIAGFFMVFGTAIDFGNRMPQLFTAAVTLYCVAALGFAAMREPRSPGEDRWLLVQAACDILALTLIMHASAGARSGLPFMMMVVIAGAGLVAEGRRVLGVAAFATIAVLAEQVIRSGFDSGLLTNSAIICLGFFAVAVASSMLGRRALASEALARRRGADLSAQVSINARIIEDMSDGVLVADAAGCLRQANPSARSLLGRELTTGIALAIAFPGVMELGSEPRVLPVGKEGRQLRLRAVDLGEGGKVIYIEDMARVQVQAQQIKLAALGRLTANIAHEIRNPLSAVAHAGDLLLEEKRGEMQQRLIRIIRDNCARIERMIKDVLELGRRDRCAPESLELESFVASFLDELGLHDPATREIVAVRLAPGLRILFDRGHLHQILWNLLTNARRYCSGRAGAVRLRAEAAGEGRISLHIEDDGPGISAEQRGQVFEPFFTSDPKGTGLGLYIARELADANGAGLDLLDSARGAHFCINARAGK